MRTRSPLLTSSPSSFKRFLKQRQNFSHKKRRKISHLFPSFILFSAGDPRREAHRKRSCQGAFFVQTSYFRGAGTIGSNVEVLCLMLLHKTGFKGSSKMSCKKKSFFPTLILLQLSTSQQSIITQIATKIPYKHNIPILHGSLYRTSSMASVATVTGGPITKEKDDKGEEGLLYLLEVAGFEQVAS